MTLENLAVSLDDRFDERAAASARARLDSAELTTEESEGADERTLAWIDLVFGGTWSREALRSQCVVARRAGAPVGFAAQGLRGLTFRWLRGLAAQPDVGVFGPFGVAPEERGGVLGPALLTLALCGLRRQGFATALIAAVTDPTLAAYYARECGARSVESFDLDALAGPKARAVVMASGAGTNFATLAEAVAGGRVAVELAAVVTNSANAMVRERARDAGVRDVVVAWDRERESREAYDVRLLAEVARLEPELVLLLGWMHLLDARFVQRFSDILNLHPAFLPLDPSHDTVTMPDGSTMPAFRGAHAVLDAVRGGSGWIGATVHRITADADRGPVVVRVPLRLGENEDEESAYARLRPLEHALVPRAVRAWSFER